MKIRILAILLSIAALPAFAQTAPAGATAASDAASGSGLTPNQTVGLVAGIALVTAIASGNGGNSGSTGTTGTR